jgi:hypothetical protein
MLKGILNGDWQEILGASIPSLGPEIRSDAKSRQELEKWLQNFFSTSITNPGIRPLVTSALLLWHDRLDESHTISQSIPSREGSYLHGVMHRREPDYSNGKYWFQRVGHHPIFGDLKGQVTSDFSLQAVFPIKGNWDPFAFIDSCEEAASLSRDHKKRMALEQIQAIELGLLIQHFLQE